MLIGHKWLVVAKIYLSCVIFSEAWTWQAVVSTSCVWSCNAVATRTHSVVPDLGCAGE